MDAPEKWLVRIDGQTFTYLDELAAIRVAKAAQAEGRAVEIKPPDSQHERFIATYMKADQGFESLPKKTSEPQPTSPAQGREPRPGRGLIWWGRVQRAVSVRIGCGSLIAGFIFGVIAAQIFGQGAAVPVTLVVAGICWLLAVFNDGQMLNCPHCQKMVKLGADTCSHCGAALR